MFDRVARLQPVAWVADGVVCAPRSGDGVTMADVAAITLPTTALDGVPAWPGAASGWVAGWYHRTPDHAPAPPGVRELVIVPGEGFGTVPHPTTAMCLAAIDTAPSAPAWDLGCGAGLLSQAWATRHRCPVHAVEVEPHAAAQARASFAAAGLADVVTLHHRTAEQLAPTVGGRVMLANLPPIAHRSIAPHITGRPRWVVVSGMRERDRAQVCDLYAHLGVQPADVHHAGPWVCVTLTPGGG